MAQATKIEWTDATWNPVTGCTKIGPGCDNCYASRFAERWRGIEGHPYEQGFDLRLWRNRIDLPIRWQKPRLIFVNSMSDLFHTKIPIEFIDTVFHTMERAAHHIYQVLKTGCTTEEHGSPANLSSAVSSWRQNYLNSNQGPSLKEGFRQERSKSAG